MNKRQLGLRATGLALLLVLVACAGGAQETADGGDSGATEVSDEAARTFKIGHPSTISIYDVVTKITHERLNAEGWNIEDVEFAQTALNPQALGQNVVQASVIIGVESLRTFQAGGDDPRIKFVMDNNAGEFTIVAKKEFASCEDFDGIRFGIHGETSSSSVAAVEWLNNECGVEPKILVIPGGENRIVALENGELDATLVQYSDLVELQNISDPGEYVEVDMGGALDWNGGNWWVNTEWAENNYDVATEYFAEVLRTCQIVRDDPSVLREATLEHTETSEESVDEVVEIYLDPERVNLCPEDGGGTELLQAIIDYNVETEEVEPIDVNDVVHPTLLEDALAKLESDS